MKNKRGASSHIEVILSFLIFFSFIIFILIFLRPQETSLVSGSTISAIHNSFLERAYTNYTAIFLKTDMHEEFLGNCFFVQLDEKVVAYGFNSRNSLVKDAITEAIAPSELEATGQINIEKSEEFYRLYMSNEFNPTTPPSGCQPLTDFKIGSINEKKIISQKKLNELKSEYDNGNYEQLKSNLGLSPNLGFAIVSEIVTMQKNIPAKTEVLAESYSEEVLFESGEIKNIIFTIKIW